MKTLLLVMALSTAGCGAADLGSARIDPVLAALVPADTIMLTGVRMAELRATPFYAKATAQQRLSELDAMAKGTNFDPRRDVNEFLLASDGVDSVVLARGSFKPKIPDGLKKSVYKGATIYTLDYSAYAILDATTAIVGPDRGVRKVIDQKQSPRPGAKALLDRARALPGRGQIWLVSNGWGALPDRAAGMGGNLSNYSRFLRSLESATATVDLRSGIASDIRGQCRTDLDAKNLADAVRGMVGLGRLSVPENQPELLRVFDGIKVEQQQRSIQLGVQIAPDLVDRLLNLTTPKSR